ncbi:MAG: alpha/beta fold hydrolase [Clostridia bacterium]|nr:alpha/beta fold hydrolase [Clostridia bacterium]
MEIRKEEFHVKSSDKKHELSGLAYVPECEPRGIFQVVHGMIEHIGRYDRFMTLLANEGYIACAHDHLGHGKSVNDENEYGFIADKDGYQRLIDDVEIFGSAVREKYGRTLPFFLMGHSMGSFIVRLAAEQYDSYDKLIIMGTGGPNPAAGPGLLMIKLLKIFKGGKGYSSFIDNVAFGTYNNRFKEENDFKSWLSSIPEEREKNKTDPICNFRFSLSGMDDLLMVNRLSNRKAWAGSLNKSKPVLLISGSEDPVGDYGKGVGKVNEMLKDAGVPVTYKLYEGARHEILNDISMDEVNKDILEFIK